MQNIISSSLLLLTCRDERELSVEEKYMYKSKWKEDQEEVVIGRGVKVLNVVCSLILWGMVVSLGWIIFTSI